MLVSRLRREDSVVSRLLCPTLSSKTEDVMAKRTEKRQEPRSFSFRMPGEVYDDLAALARARGVDVSGILNWILSQHQPVLRQMLAEHEKAMKDAAEAREWERMGPAEGLRALRELLGKLQDAYTEMSSRALGKDERPAA